jgi:hypothetical protein
MPAAVTAVSRARVAATAACTAARLTTDGGDACERGLASCSCARRRWRWRLIWTFRKIIIRRLKHGSTSRAGAQKSRPFDTCPRKAPSQKSIATPGFKLRTTPTLLR